MRITYTVPFRVGFCLDRETVLANHAAWLDDKVAKARANLPKLPSVALGNYGWATASYEVDKEGTKSAKPQIVHGEDGMDDPTWFFRDHFTLRFGDSEPVAELPEFEADPGLDALFRSSSVVGWECQIIDNTVSMLVLSADVPFPGFLAFLKERADRKQAEPFIEYGVNWAKSTLSNKAESIHLGIEWATNELTPPKPKSAEPLERVFLKASSPMYAKGKNFGTFNPLWAHLAFAFNPQEREQLESHRAAYLRLFASPPTRALAESWLDGGPNTYGWGATTVLEDPRYGRQWLDGLCISQYYYVCADILDTALPFELARQRESSDKRHYRDVMVTSRSIRQAVKRLLADHADLRAKTSGEGREALVGYYATWRMQDLTAGLSSKLEWLESLVTEASDRAKERNQRMIGHILTFITLLSLISFIGGVQDYLAADYDPGSPGRLSELALQARKASVAIGSFVVFLLAFIAYLLIDRRH